jgi:hypothetical protein
VFLMLVLKGLDRPTAAAIQVTEPKAPPTQPDEATSRGVVTFAQAAAPASVSPREHLKSDATSVVKYDKD